MTDYLPDLDVARRVAELPLFAAAARRTDPTTSHDAAARAPVRGHCQRILAALAAGPGGQTEIARRAGLTVAAVSKRLPDLRRCGAIVADGVTVSSSGGRETRYRASDRGARCGE